LAQRFLAAFEILALPASESTRFLMVVTSRLAERPSAFPAARTPSNLWFNLPNSFLSLRSSRLIAAKMSIYSSVYRIYLKRKRFTRRTSGVK
jgi:hypothetical protein